MGKPLKGARLRARQRERKAVEELQEKQAEDVSFVVDRSGNSKLQERLVKKKEKQDAVDLDKAKIDRLLRVHGEDKVKLMAEEGRKRLAKQKRSRKQRGVDQSPLFSMWGADETPNKDDGETIKRPQVVAGVAPIRPTTVALPVQNNPQKEQEKVKALPALGPSKEVPTGQSYRPEPTAHAELITKAADVEINRNKAIEYDKTPLAQGMRPETRALLVDDDSSSSESDDEDDDEQDKAGPAAALQKRTHKLTRAERNKQRRLRLQHRDLAAKRKAKELTKQLGRIDEFHGHLRKQQQKPKPVKVKRTQPKQQNPRTVPSLAVALAPSTSLRTVEPRGLLVSETSAKKQVAKRRKLSYKGHKNRVGEIKKDWQVLG